MARIFTHQLVSREQINHYKETIDNLVKQIQHAQSFIKEIESGNLEIDFEGQLQLNEGDDQALAASLLSMRDQMRKIARDEKQRNWATEGLAKFVDILRSNNDDLSELSNLIISNIVKYMNANQGSLYILDDTDSTNIHLNLVACYAFNRKKHIKKQIDLGEGLVGQCILEKAPVYMTNIPDDYLKITSGLGEALPKNLLIVPLLLNDEVYGAIELASFTIFEKHHRDFIEKLAESIASTISNAKVNEQTRKLLRESQLQTETMRSHEEEMRQNMEELAATQEEMQRILREVESKEAYLNQLLNVSSDSIFTIDRQYRLVSWNKTFAATLEQYGMQLFKGMNTIDWYQGEERENQLAIYNRVLSGESFDFTASSEQNGKAIYHLSLYTPLKNADGEVYEAAIFAKDITDMMNAQKKAEKLVMEAQEKAEEMKAQEEELRQNMEELSATQEEMQRILNEVQSKEAYLNALLNASKDSIFTIDKEYKLMSFNDSFSAGLKQIGLAIDKGFFIFDLFPDENQKAVQRSYYQRAFSGESFEETSQFEYNGVTSYYTSSFSPLKNDQNEIYAVAVFGKDLTELYIAKNKAEKFAAEAHERAEEMKAQEEELRQNLEELSATQEEMQRIVTELHNKSAYATSLLDASDDVVFTIDREFKLVTWNKAFDKMMAQFGSQVTKGFNTLEWYPDEKQRKDQINLYKRVFKGEPITNTFTTDNNGQAFRFKTSYKPLVNEKGEVFEVVSFTRNITKEENE